MFVLKEKKIKYSNRVYNNKNQVVDTTHYLYVKKINLPHNKVKNHNDAYYFFLPLTNCDRLSNKVVLFNFVFGFY